MYDFYSGGAFDFFEDNVKQNGTKILASQISISLKVSMFEFYFLTTLHGANCFLPS
jgi:hypothetical protein